MSRARQLIYDDGWLRRSGVACEEVAHDGDMLAPIVGLRAESGAPHFDEWDALGVEKVRRIVRHLRARTKGCNNREWNITGLVRIDGTGGRTGSGRVDTDRGVTIHVPWYTTIPDEYLETGTPILQSLHRRQPTCSVRSPSERRKLLMVGARPIHITASM